jgi:hypothetical protein
VKPAADLQGIGILADSAAVSNRLIRLRDCLPARREPAMRRTQPHGEVIAGRSS